MTMNDRPMTPQQRKAMFLFFRKLSDALNDAGLDAKKTLKPEMEIPWTPEMIKRCIWDPIQEALVEKTSTTELNTIEPSKVYEIINRNMAEKFGIHVPWPDRMGQLLEKK